jgi:hypothetical protein
VKRLLSLVLTASWLIFSSGCGNVFFRGAIQTGSTVTGSVSIVQLSAVTDGTVQVTFVTFLQNGTSSTFGFCGDQTSLFPLNQTVRANFNPGQPCATIITVVIII